MPSAKELSSGEIAAVDTIRHLVRDASLQTIRLVPFQDMSKLVMRRVEATVEDQRLFLQTGGDDINILPVLLLAKPEDRDLLEGITVSLNRGSWYGDEISIKNKLGETLSISKFVRSFRQFIRIDYDSGFTHHIITDISHLSQDQNPPKDVTYLGLSVGRGGFGAYANEFVVKLPFDQVQLAMPVKDKGWLLTTPSEGSKVGAVEVGNQENKLEIDFTESSALEAAQKWQSSEGDFFEDFWNMLGGSRTGLSQHETAVPPHETMRAEPHMNLNVQGLTAAVEIQRIATRLYGQGPSTTDIIMVTIKHIDRAALENGKIKMAKTGDDARDLVMYWTRLDNGEIKAKNSSEWRDTEDYLRQQRGVISPEQMAAITSLLSIEQHVVYDQTHPRPKPRRPERPQRRRGRWG